ncbi:TRAP transporter fused permease subunit [Pseudoflavonifractor sp. 60]|uniref:TRAP transporter permease n=1 Tax=Pseudoflavonifractor sp. 60 TaxID=2304576 RepID=UPI00325A9C45
MSFWKKEKGSAPPVSEAAVDSQDTGSAADLEEVMKKYDRESNVRIWEGWQKWAVKCIFIGFSLFCLYLTLWDTRLPEFRLAMFVGLVVVIGYLNFPMRKGNVKPNSLPWYDIIIMVVGSAPFFYFAINASTIKTTSAVAASKDPMMLTLAILGALAMIELCRRSVGIPILCVVGVLLIYAFTQVRFGKVIYDLFYTTSGIIGTPIATCQKFIVVFIIFGAFLERTGISAFFINLANCVAGSASGGPAKVAVISSALCGMVSGSSVGNTVTTGSVTIPMMKKTGYKGEFAGAVEAAASTGGQIMPPIMGAAAFLMSEYTGFPYAQIALLAVLPALLYFTGIFIAVHLEAKKLGLKGIPKEQLPKFTKLLPKIYLLLPLIILVAMVSSGTRTMQFSAAIAILVTIVVGLINNVVNHLTGNEDKTDNISFMKVLDSLEAGAKGTITVAAACAMAGLVAGCITTTGLANILLRTIVSVSGGVTIIALFLTMLCCIVLGMGVPTTANYCIMAATCAPILMSEQIGVPMIAAHFFVFYFGIVADITPPVALAAYAGSAIAKSTPMKTAFNATKLAIAAFVVPYIFALNPTMLFQFEEGTTMTMKIVQAVLIIVTSLAGLFGVASALNGYLYRPINPLFRILIAAGGLCMMIPGELTDVIGLVVVAGVVIFQRMGAKHITAA